MLIFNIILLFLISTMLSNLIRPNSNKNILSCGNFGWTGDDVSKFNRDKFITLGILNESRGTDSCGIFVDGELYRGDNIGSNNEAKFRDMMIKHKFPNPKDIPVIIGHTRNSSRGGTKSVENTHPFKFIMEDGKYFIGAHNGTLKNHSFLAEKYGIDERDNGRLKVDSEILLEILSKQKDDNSNKNIKVLQEYTGRAALVMFSEREPENVWFFKGKSKVDTWANAITEVERPLHYWYDQEGSMYWSSLPEHLEIIAGKRHTEEDVEIYTFPDNGLVAVKGGRLGKAIDIDRTKNKKYSTMVEYNRALKDKEKKKTKYVRKEEEPKENHRKKTIVKNHLGNSEGLTETEILQSKSIFFEKILRTCDELDDNSLRYERLRYMNGDSFAKNGVYIYSKQRGLIYVSDSITKTREILKDYKIISHNSKSNISKVFGDCSDLTLYYLYNGLMLKNEHDYIVCMDSADNFFTNSQMSHMSKYPVCHYYTGNELTVNKHEILESKKDEYKNKIIANGEICLYDYFKPIGSTYSYVVRNGMLDNSSIKMVPNPVDDKDKILDENDSIKSGDFKKNIQNVLKNTIKETDTDDEESELDDEDLYNKYDDFINAMDESIEIGKSIVFEHPEKYDQELNIAEWLDNFEKSYKPIKNYIESTIFENDCDSCGEVDEDEQLDEEEYTYIAMRASEDMYNEFSPNFNMDGSNTGDENGNF